MPPRAVAAARRGTRSAGPGRPTRTTGRSAANCRPPIVSSTAAAGHVLERVIPDEMLVDPVRAPRHRFAVQECQLGRGAMGDRIVQKLAGESISAPARRAVNLCTAMAEDGFPKVGHFKDVARVRSAAARAIGATCRSTSASSPRPEGSPLAQPLDVGGFVVGNRWCIHPMEGWDGTTDGQPTEHTIRRWEHFGESGAKLIWGGEAFAVQADGRANPQPDRRRSTATSTAPRAAWRRCSKRSPTAHREKFGNTDDLLVGLQLTHSGRFCRPYDKKKLEPRIAYHHPILDREVRHRARRRLRRHHRRRHQAAHRQLHPRREARAAASASSFVDVKHCHGYLGHELLSAVTRPGPYGGSFENRTRFAREIIQGIQAECPGLMIGVRLSAFDTPPFKPDPTRGGSGKLGPGIPGGVPARSSRTTTASAAIRTTRWRWT